MKFYTKVQSSTLKLNGVILSLNLWFNQKLKQKFEGKRKLRDTIKTKYY